MPWFAARARDIALETNGARRKERIKELEASGDPLWDGYKKAVGRMNAAARVAKSNTTYRHLNTGKLNIYKLFVERAFQLVKRTGMVGLLAPSGIASDMSSSRFFKGVATEGRLKALYDFENRRTRFGAEPFFPDVDSRFKFCVFVASPVPTAFPARCAFFLQDVSELADQERCFSLSAEDFARVNPNTGTAPIFRTRRDAELATSIYRRVPVLVEKSAGQENRTWPVKYAQMINMTSDSGDFRTEAELEEREGAYPVGNNRFGSADGEWVPLYEGKMVQAFDHRAASIEVNAANQHRPAQPVPATVEQHADPAWLPKPQYWIKSAQAEQPNESTTLAFKDVTSPTNVRSMIAALIPYAGLGNTLPALLDSEPDEALPMDQKACLLGNLNSIVFDFVARQKIQGQHLNWFIVEQLPLIQPETFTNTSFGPRIARELVSALVLELSYTAHDMAPFARDMGFVDAQGSVRPPFRWDEERRLQLRAKLDAIFFLLYGVTDRDDVRYIYSTFPIVERQEREAHNGQYRSMELCLAYMNALAAGNPDAEVVL